MRVDLVPGLRSCVVNAKDITYIYQQQLVVILGLKQQQINTYSQARQKMRDTTEANIFTFAGFANSSTAHINTPSPLKEYYLKPRPSLAKQIPNQLISRSHFCTNCHLYGTEQHTESHWLFLSPT